jgi:uncharacterized protein (DUF1499 family)
VFGLGKPILVALAASAALAQPPGAGLAPCPDRPNCVSSRSRSPRSRVAPLPFAGDPEEALGRLKRVLAGLARLTVVAQRPGYLRAVAASRLLGFKDDVEFLADPAAKVIDVRSASRLGAYDFGVNRRRVEEIRRLYGAAAP